MLPNNAIVETVYKVARFLLQLFFRDNSNLFQEVLDNAITGSLLIDCSTVSNRVLLQNKRFLKHLPDVSFDARWIQH